MFQGHQKVSVATRREAVDDLVLMSKVDEASIVAVLRKRFLEIQSIYTYIGPVLISVNPYERIPGTVGPEVMNYYKGKFQHENIPHIYALAEDAYRNMRNEKQSHCVIISGESGAGKTECAKMIMGYIAYASGAGAGVDYVKSVILDSNPLLEAFGNANTIRNDNSSRFGKYFEIQFDKRGNPCGGNINNYLLEKSRVVRQTDGERNFHIFYQLVVGAPPDVIDALQLYEPQFFHYLNQSSTVKVPTINDKEWYTETIRSMDTMGFAQEEKDSVFQILAGILHFGNVSFVENKEGYADVDSSTLQELDLAANYFGCEPSILKSAVLFRVITTGGAGGRMSTYNSPQNIDQAAGARDALSKDIYSRTFDYIVRKVNTALQANATPSDLVIGILDIFGFEIFKINGFEQFCINFVNEKLQQYFIELTLKAEQEEYVKEGIEWTPIKYFDNQIVLDLIEGKKPPGIFSLIDDMGATAHAMESAAVDAKALDKLKGTCGSNPHFRGMDTAFSIKHYAGNVTYEMNGFIERNKDTLFPDLIETMQSSSNPFIAALFPEDTSGTQNKRPTTAGFKIKTSAAELMTALSRYQPHYIRCIKPNDNKKAKEFDEKRVAHQVQYLGLLENVKVRRAGFAYRAEFARFIQRYKKTSQQTWGMWGEWKGNPQQGCTAILSDNGVQKTDYQMGKTKIFLKAPETLFFMEEQIEKFAFDCTVRIQNAWRQFKLRRKALEEAAQAADLFRGRKQRQRESINRKFLADYMRYAENYGLQEAVKQGGGAGEDMVFANAIECFNRRLKTEKRDFVITNKALYFVSRKKKGDTVLYKVTKRTDLGQVTQLSLSPLSDDYLVVHCSDFDQAFFDPNKTEITTKIINYARALTGRDIPLQFQQSINWKIKTGDTRTLTFQQGVPSVSKTGKAVSVTVGPGLDANTDTTPSAWKAKLEKLRQGYTGPKQVKSQIAAVRAAKGEMTSFDARVVAAKSPRDYDGGGEEEEASGYGVNPVPAVRQPQAMTAVKGPKAAKGPKKGMKKEGGAPAGDGQGPAKMKMKMKEGAIVKGKGPKKAGPGAGVVPPAAQAAPAHDDEAVPAAQPLKAAKGPKMGDGAKGPKKVGAVKKAVKAPVAAARPAGPQAKALYAYAANAADELTFEEGEIMEIQQKDPSGWWECKRSDGTIGWAPATYITEV